jgi:NitT/TauT family transport system permease protein
MTALRSSWPVLAVLAALVAVGYPLALAFGLPLARRDMQDVRKWLRETVRAEAPLDLTPMLERAGTITPDEVVTSTDTVPSALLAVLGGRVLAELPTADAAAGLEVRALEAAAGGPLVQLSEPWERVSDGVLAAPEAVLAAMSLSEAVLALYADRWRLIPAADPAYELPDGQRTDFSFPAGADGPVLVGGERLVEGEGYQADGVAVELARPAPFGSSVRRMRGEVAVLDAEAGTVALAADALGAAPATEVRSALQVVRFAERLEGAADGTNRRFTVMHERLLEVDPERLLMVEDRPLSPTAERPAERVDGAQRSFTFPSDAGIVVVDGVVAAGGAYTREGPVITFRSAPERNAQIRQHPGAYLEDPATGTFLLATPPAPGERVWAARYTYSARPGCGDTLLACFFALPQHPVPFPHWIVTRVEPFFGKYPIDDPRNVVRATAYTSLGTLSALGLGAAVGVVLAVLFVLMRPLERAVFPWVIASQTVPIIALVPVLLLVLGNAGITIQTSLLPTAIIGAYIAFFPVVVGTVKGLRSVDPLALDLMRSYAASPRAVFLKVRFPAAMPYLVTSLKLGTAAALVGALVAETESNNRRGLGYQILGQVQAGNVADVWILLLVSALLGIGLVAVVGLVGRVLAPWWRG